MVLVISLSKGIALTHPGHWIIAQCKNKLLLSVIIFFISNNFLFGAVENADGILSLFKVGLESWESGIKSACLWVFYTLAVIDLAWSFSLSALRGGEFSDFLILLIRKIMIFGIFLFLFNTHLWIDPIWQSFSQLATGVNQGRDVTPANIITQAIELVKIIFDKLDFKAESIMYIICGVIILIAIVFMAIELFIVYIKFFLMNICVFFALTLGALEQFKQIGLNPILSFIKIGIELFFIQGLIALSINSIEMMHVEISKEKTIELILTILATALIFVIVVKQVSGVIESIFQGTIGNNADVASGFKAIAATAMAGAAMATSGAGTIGGAFRAVQAARGLSEENGNSVLGNLAKSAQDTLKTNIDKGIEDLSKNSFGGKMADDLNAKTEDLKAQKENNILGEVGGAEENSNNINSESTYHSPINENLGNGNHIDIENDNTTPQEQDIESKEENDSKENNAEEINSEIEFEEQDKDTKKGEK